ncbi:MAG: hypothetical protein HKN95_00260 [Acidimicrobiia bacterium]|nr:hypothetical protein [Acidimicrobiia bacterium]
MRQQTRHRCDFCGGNAVAFQRGASVCGRCGIDRTTGRSKPSVKSKRMALVGLFSSGLFIKLMLGSVAFAAVGTWAAAAVMAPNPATAPLQTQVTVTEEATATIAESALAGEEPAMTIDEIVAEANEQAAAAHDMATAAKEWADCVSAAAIEHRDGVFDPFDPELACPSKPHPSDFGLGQSQRPDDAGKPDHPTNPEQANDGNKEEAPGAENRPSDEDKEKDEKKVKDAADDGASEDG